MYLNISPWFFLLSFLAGGAQMLLGVIAGGFLVFRTKRESHERLFEKPLTGSTDSVAYVEGEGLEAPDPVPNMFGEIERRNADLLRQIQREKDTMKRENDHFTEQVGDIVQRVMVNAKNKAQPQGEVGHIFEENE
jgi:hypothetical protein